MVEEVAESTTNHVECENKEEEQPFPWISMAFLSLGMLGHSGKLKCLE